MVIATTMVAIPPRVAMRFIRVIEYLLLSFNIVKSGALFHSMSLLHSMSLWVKPVGYHWTLGQYVFAFGPIPEVV
jgi:hypothetical protein